MINPLRHKGIVLSCLVLALVWAGWASAGMSGRPRYRFVARRVLGGFGSGSSDPFAKASMVVPGPDHKGDWILRTVPQGPRRQVALFDSWPTIWMEPYPAAFNGDASQSVVDGVWSFGPDAEPEAVFHSYLPDRSRAVFQRHRIGDGHMTARFELPTGQDPDGSGSWDGNIRVAGVMDVPTPQGDRQAMILVCNAGRDLQPRGVQAVDARTGEVLWTYFFGPKPEWDSFALADLDGDGVREIIVAGSAVDNIHAGYFHGTRDDTSRVFVLDNAGKLRWSRPFAPFSSRVFIQALGAREDSPPAIVAGVMSSDPQVNGLYLLDGEGRLVGHLRVPSGIRDLSRLSDRRQDAEFVALAGLSVVTRISCADSLHILARRRLPEPVHVVGILDVAPEPGPEILVQGRDHWLLSSSLDILAHEVSPDHPIARGGFGFFRTDRDSVLLYGQGSEGTWAYELAPNPDYLAWGLAVGMVVLGVSVPWVRKRLRNRRPTEATRRELQLQLLDRLKLSGHGAIGGLSAVRRLVWNLNALAQGFALGEDRLRVMDDLLADIKGNQLPKLASALELARLAELGRRETEQATGTLAKLSRELDQAAAALKSGAMDVAAVQNLKEAAEEAEMAFQALRKAVEASFRVDIEPVVAQSVAGQQERIAAEGVTVETRLEGVPACCMDAEELAFVVDNLVENAVRAMAGGRERRLVIDWKDGGGWITLRFADTGCGIVPDDWQRIFEAGQTTRKGGGLGLSRSREILRKYGGGLMVESSEPGAGTVMALTLAKVMDHPG